MLGKLIHHEWKAVWKVLTLINAFTVLVTLLGCLSLYSPLWRSNVEYVGLLGFSYLTLYYITIIIVSFSTMIFLAVRFYKNIYTDEGYLTHTLPVTTNDLILSKLIVAFIWTILTGLLIFISVFLLGTIFILNIDDSFTLNTLYSSFVEGIRLIFGTSLPVFSFLITFALLVSTLAAIVMVYGAISLGQLFQKHKILGSFLSYVGIYMVSQTITAILITPFTTKMMFAQTGSAEAAISEYMNKLLLTSMIPTVIMGIALYVLTHYIMSKKLNLD